MRKFIFSLCFCSISLFAIASSRLLPGPGGILIEKIVNKDTVEVFLFNGVTSSSIITYTGSGTTINWYKYGNLTTPQGTQTDISPESDTGYILDVDGKKTAIWVIDYQNFTPTLTSIEPDPQTVSPCDGVNLLINANVPVMSYQSPTKTYTLEREFSIKYDNEEWSGTKWNPVTGKTVSLTLPASSYLLQEILLANTTFTLSGDQFAEKLGVTVSPVKCDYSAIAVQCHLTATVTKRTETNELERPTDISATTISAPVDIHFLSNPSDGVTHYLWEIYRDKILILNVPGNNTDLQHTFIEAGTYKVKVTVNSDKCTYSDSLEVNISESDLQVPNAFSPNGDEYNQEFRVQYKSLKSFECWVFNRQGREVFHWNDPQKGWNGKINGKDAPDGPYFYIIKAYGTDYNASSKPNSKTKLRLGEYFKKGDINLLRGKVK